MGWVFVRQGGEHLVPDEVSDRFRALVAESGLPPVTLHGLRCRICDHHGTATIRPAAHSDGVEHLTAEHHATIGTAPD